jgi:frataxin-like iron-binding protein CyaY
VLRVKNKVIDTALKHAKQYMDKYNNTFSAEKVNSYYLIVNTLQVERQIWILSNQSGWRNQFYDPKNHRCFRILKSR